MIRALRSLVTISGLSVDRLSSLKSVDRLATMLSVALSKYPRALLRLPCKSRALQKLCSSQAATELDGLFTTDEFVTRHIGPRDHDQTAMLDVLGFKVRYNILHLPFSNQSTEAGVTFCQRENYCLSLQCETADLHHDQVVAVNPYIN